MSIQISMDESRQSAQTQDQQPQVPQRPDFVPEKFWNSEKGEVNLEALVKSQRDAEAELNRLRAQLQQQKPQQRGTDEQPNAQPSGKPSLAELRAAAAQEFMQNGSLSDETYAKFESIGVDRDTVDAVIEGQRSRMQARQAKLFEAAEVTREQFTQASEWAAKNLTQDEIAQLNRELADPITAASAIRKLYARYTQEANVDGNLQTGVAPGSTVTGEYYRSMDEMMEVIKSEKYQKGDPETHQMHIRKLLNSEKAGINLYTRAPTKLKF